MESINSFNFHNKSSIIPLFDKFHDHNCMFKIIDDFKLKMLIEYEDKKYDKVNIVFADKVLDSFTIYNLKKEEDKFIGKIIDNNLTYDLENLHIELIDSLFSNSDLILFAVDSLEEKYSNRIVVKFVNIMNIIFL